jgi:hypothetical protein
LPVVAAQVREAETSCGKRGVQVANARARRHPHERHCRRRLPPQLVFQWQQRPERRFAEQVDDLDQRVFGAQDVGERQARGHGLHAARARGHFAHELP